MTLVPSRLLALLVGATSTRPPLGGGSPPLEVEFLDVAASRCAPSGSAPAYPLAAAQPVALVCLHAVPAGATPDSVAPSVARTDHVAPRATEEQIAAWPAVDLIAAAVPGDAVVSLVSGEKVVQLAASECVVAGSSEEGARDVPRCDQAVVSSATVHEEEVTARRDASRRDDRVIPSGTERANT